MQLNIENKPLQTNDTFFFEPIENKFMKEKEVSQIFLKWGLNESLKIISLRFNQKYDDLNAKEFIHDLFNNPNVRYLLNNLAFSKQAISQITFQKLKCTQTTLDLFEKLVENRIVVKQYIQKTYGEDFQGIQISDLIRECLLKQQSDHYCVFNQNQRKELLLKIFQLFVIGGSMNQYEDLITPYLDWTKKLYKHLVTVRKDSQTSTIFVQSYFYAIKKIPKVFEAGYNPQDLLYVVINPSNRVVHIINNKWVKFW